MIGSWRSCDCWPRPERPEIARQLFVSINTLRTHTKRIFTKLDVNTRAAAVSRAADLGLL